MKHALAILLILAVALTLWVLAERRNPPGSAGSVGFELIDLQGRELDLAKYRGKVILVNFWATWCQPCRIEIPWLIEFQEKYAGRGFTVLGVAMDDEGRSVVEPWLANERFELDGRQVSVNYPILIGNEAVEKQFDGLLGLPTSVLITRDGTRVKRFIGLIQHDVLQEEIEKLLANP